MFVLFCLCVRACVRACVGRVVRLLMPSYKEHNILDLKRVIKVLVLIQNCEPFLFQTYVHVSFSM